MRLHAKVPADVTATFWEAAGFPATALAGHFAVRWIRVGGALLIGLATTGWLLGAIVGAAVGAGIAIGLSLGAFLGQAYLEGTAIPGLAGPARTGKERLTFWPTPSGLRLRGQNTTATLPWDRVTVAGTDPVVVTVGRVSLAVARADFSHAAPGRILRRWAATRCARTTVRVPVEDVVRFWQTTAATGMGRLPVAMLRYGSIGFLTGLAIGWPAGGPASGIGFGFGLGVVAALAPVVPEIDVLRSVFGAAGERVDLVATETGVRIISDWQSVEGTLRRVQGRIHIQAGNARLSVPAAAFEDKVQLSRLLESA